MYRQWLTGAYHDTIQFLHVVIAQGCRFERPSALAMRTDGLGPRFDQMRRRLKANGYGLSECNTAEAGGHTDKTNKPSTLLRRSRERSLRSRLVGLLWCDRCKNAPPLAMTANGA